MEMHTKSAKYLYLFAAGALGQQLALRAGIWWFIRGQQRAEPQHSLEDNGAILALYTIDGSGPLARYDEIYTRLLPEGDALALQQGVPITDERESQKNGWKITACKARNCLARRGFMV